VDFFFPPPFPPPPPQPPPPPSPRKFMEKGAVVESRYAYEESSSSFSLGESPLLSPLEQITLHIPLPLPFPHPPPRSSPPLPQARKSGKEVRERLRSMPLFLSVSSEVFFSFFLFPSSLPPSFRTKNGNTKFNGMPSAPPPPFSSSFSLPGKRCKNKAKLTVSLSSPFSRKTFFFPPPPSPPSRAV